MKLLRLVLVVGAMLLSSACASIIEGTTQTLSFESNPPEAECTLVRNGVTIGKVTTRGGIVVEKTKHDINVKCSKGGFQDSTAHLKSEVAGATFGNIILGGGIGWAIDSASGADNHYQEVTTVTLVPGSAPGSPAPTGAPEPATPLSREQRLRELDALKEQKLITGDEYRAKRQAIIDTL